MSQETTTNMTKVKEEPRDVQLANETKMYTNIVNEEMYTSNSLESESTYKEANIKKYEEKNSELSNDETSTTANGHLQAAKTSNNDSFEDKSACRESLKKSFRARNFELQSIDVDEEKMPALTGSYSEILGKPLFMTLAEEQIAPVIIFSQTPQHQTHSCTSSLKSNKSSSNETDSDNGFNDSVRPKTKAIGGLHANRDQTEHEAKLRSLPTEFSALSAHSDRCCQAPQSLGECRCCAANEGIVAIGHCEAADGPGDHSLRGTACGHIEAGPVRKSANKPTSLPHLQSCLETASTPISSGYYYKYYASLDNEDMKDEAELKTPVNEDLDPRQALLSHHRLAAYLASPDLPPPDVTPSYDTPSVPAAVCDKPLAVGRCQADLAEAALRSVGKVMRLPDNTVAFVADDLNEKIKLSSPVAVGSGSSTPQFFHSRDLQGSGAFCYSLATPPQSLATPLYPYNGRPPPLDASLLNDLEKHARQLASNVDGLVESLTDALHGISALTVDCVETYRDTVCKTCDAVDANIKSMYQLMAKVEELSKAMKPVYALHAQIKEVRRTLDMLEAEMHS